MNIRIAILSGKYEGKTVNCCGMIDYDGNLFYLQICDGELRDQIALNKLSFKVLSFSFDGVPK